MVTSPGGCHQTLKPHSAGALAGSSSSPAARPSEQDGCVAGLLAARSPVHDGRHDRSASSPSPSRTASFHTSPARLDVARSYLRAALLCLSPLLVALGLTLQPETALGFGSLLAEPCRNPDLVQTFSTVWQAGTLRDHDVRRGSGRVQTFALALKIGALWGHGAWQGSGAVQTFPPALQAGALWGHDAWQVSGAVQMFPPAGGGVPAWGGHLGRLRSEFLVAHCG
jgi:hypothetical protein